MYTDMDMYIVLTLTTIQFTILLLRSLVCLATFMLLCVLHVYKVSDFRIHTAPLILYHI